MQTRIGPARFTALTPGIWRIEWQPDGDFSDEPTLTSWQRPSGRRVARREVGDWIELDNGTTCLRYRDDGKIFHRGNLQVVFEHRGKRKRWHPGLSDKGNLGGPRRTLDAFHGRSLYSKEAQALVEQAEEPGLLSRDGWVLLDETDTPHWPVRDADRWPVARPVDGRCDWYLLAFGRDYGRGLQESAVVFGHTPLPPRWTLGLWISRWWAYTDRELEELVAEYRRHGCGLDVAVLDMEWHTEGWGGYDWDRNFFPDHHQTLTALHDAGVKVAANLHPAGGIGREQSTFRVMAQATGTPANADKVPFDCSDPAFMRAYFTYLHHPHEAAGIDCWWMDWQQGCESAIAGLDPLPMLNHQHWHDQADRATTAEVPRPLCFSRYGGIGSGRYPFGFSGDTESSWRSLKYLVSFTAQSANALYGWWSHDVGGFFESPWEGRLSPELYLRWVQFARFSPIMRTHAGRIAHADRRFWLWGEPHGLLMIEAVQGRYRWSAWLYSEQATASRCGIPAIRSCYIDHPEVTKAYRPEQYSINDRLHIAPITSPVDPITDLAAQDLWLPPDRDWVDVDRGGIYTGDRSLRGSWLLAEIPHVIEAGSLVPGYDKPENLGPDCLQRMSVDVFPGARGRYDQYEDDGWSQAYSDGQHATIRWRQRSSAQRTTVRALPVVGGYDNMSGSRELIIRLRHALPPRQVLVDGQPCSAIDRSDCGTDGWWYDEQTASVCIRQGQWQLGRGLTVRIDWQAGLAPLQLPALAGINRRCVAAFHRLRACMHEAMRPAAHLAQVLNRCGRWPDHCHDELAALPSAISRLRRQLARAQADITPGKRAEAQVSALAVAGQLLADAAKLLKATTSDR